MSADQFPDDFLAEAAVLAVVGVAGDARYGGARSAIGPVLYVPLEAQPVRNVQVLMRADAPVAFRAARDALRRWDANVPLLREGALDDWIRQSTQATRATAIALTLLALLGGALAASGVYGMASLSLRQREHELAVRLSLGAKPGDVAGRILAEVGLPAALGVTIGLIAMAPLLRTVQHLLYGPPIPWSWALGGPAVAMAVVVLVAAGSVAARAARLSPAELLRTN